MADVFTKRKRSEVMSRIRGKGNRDTEIALAKLLRAEGITGWRRQQKIRVEGGGMKAERGKTGIRVGGGRQKTGDRRGNRGEDGKAATSRRTPKLWRTRRTTVRVDFVFRKERVAVFVDGCFWHGCPKHSSPGRWLRKSSMERRGTTETLRQAQGDKRGRRTGKKFWAGKMAGNIARDQRVTRTLRRTGWRVVRLWEHDLVKNSGRCVERVRRALGR